MKYLTIYIITIVAVGGAYLLLKDPTNQQNVQNYTPASVNNVSIVDGKQIITINAKGGYQPRKSLAKAGIPTVIRFNTSGTFDCSSSVRIPSLGIQKILPQNGNTDIDIGVPSVATLQGMCGMGMYRFEVDFQT